MEHALNVKSPASGSPGNILDLAEHQARERAVYEATKPVGAPSYEEACAAYDASWEGYDVSKNAPAGMDVAFGHDLGFKNKGCPAAARLTQPVDAGLTVEIMQAAFARRDEA